MILVRLGTCRDRPQPDPLAILQPGGPTGALHAAGSTTRSQISPTEGSMAAWRLGYRDESLKTFARICLVNPADNTGARFCWYSVKNGEGWQG